MRVLIRVCGALVLGAALFVYLVCGAASDEHLKNQNFMGLTCILEETSNMNNPKYDRNSSTVCSQWQEMQKHRPWYERLYEKATFEREHK